MVRVLHVSFSDASGGAGRAAGRIHSALVASGIDSQMLVARKDSLDDRISRPVSALRRVGPALRALLVKLLLSKLGFPGSSVSLSLLPSSWHKLVNQSSADVVNLHWLGAEMMSIRDISRINKPVVWTLHDEWPFSGMHHYQPEVTQRLSEVKQNNSSVVFLRMLDRVVYRAKLHYLKRPASVVAPSEWIAHRVRTKGVMKGWPVHQIHHPISAEAWEGIAPRTARDILGIQQDLATVLFGAVGGEDPRKGFDLLRLALANLREMGTRFQVILFGGGAVPELATSYQVKSFGPVKDEMALRLIYSAADVLAFPSRQENYSLVLMEAMSCGTPAVGFGQTGNSSIIEHKVNGYLAKPFDTHDFAAGLNWAISQTEQTSSGIRQTVVNEARNRFSPSSTVSGYVEVYKNAIARWAEAKAS